MRRIKTNIKPIVKRTSIILKFEKTHQRIAALHEIFLMTYCSPCWLQNFFFFQIFAFSQSEYYQILDFRKKSQNDGNTQLDWWFSMMCCCKAWKLPKCRSQDFRLSYIGRTNTFLETESETFSNDMTFNLMKKNGTEFFQTTILRLIFSLKLQVQQHGTHESRL